MARSNVDWCRIGAASGSGVLQPPVTTIPAPRRDMRPVLGTVESAALGRVLRAGRPGFQGHRAVGDTVAGLQPGEVVAEVRAGGRRGRAGTAGCRSMTHDPQPGSRAARAGRRAVHDSQGRRDAPVALPQAWGSLPSRARPQARTPERVALSQDTGAAPHVTPSRLVWLPAGRRTPRKRNRKLVSTIRGRCRS